MLRKIFSCWYLAHVEHFFSEISFTPNEFIWYHVIIAFNIKIIILWNHNIVSSSASISTISSSNVININVICSIVKTSISSSSCSRLKISFVAVEVDAKSSSLVALMSVVLVVVALLLLVVGIPNLNWSATLLPTTLEKMTN